MAQFYLPKREFPVGKTKPGKGTKIMAITNTGDVVLSVSVQSASPHEVTLVETTPEDRLVGDLLEKLIGNTAYNSNPLDDRLAEKGVEMIAPRRKGRVK